MELPKPFVYVLSIYIWTFSLINIIHLTWLKAESAVFMLHDPASIIHFSVPCLSDEKNV